MFNWVQTIKVCIFWSFLGWLGFQASGSLFMTRPKSIIKKN